MSASGALAELGPLTGSADGAGLLDISAIKVALPDCGVVRVGGKDARDFLHAQLCGDCRALAPGATLLTGWCSPQGRVLYLPRLLAGADGIYLLLPAAQVEALCKRLRMFVLRAAVEIEDLRTSHGVMWLSRGDALPADLLERVAASARSAQQHWYVARTEVLMSAWQAQDAVAGAPSLALLAGIRAGEVPLDAALADRFLPQELALEQHGGLSFDKGCYPGQEIIARVRYRGKVKRQPLRLRAEGPPPPAATRLFDDAGASVGTVLAAAALAEGCELLAVVDSDATPARIAEAATGARVTAAG
jgi:folate-binding protein YgfZ